MDNIRAPFLRLMACAAVAILSTVPADLQAASDAEQQAELAKKLANPVAALISVPFQYNYDEHYGAADEGSVHRLNIQPVIPASLSDNWNLITRAILPLVDQNDIPSPDQGKSGVGDITASLFLSPKAPTENGWIWGVGPVALLPTASDEMLGAEKWGLGPTAVGLKQVGPWTMGALVNHIWSVAGEDDRADINSTFLQPFLFYITSTKTTLGVSVESTYDWENEAWSVPINVTVSQLLKIGPQIVQIGVGARYWAESPDNGPEDWGARASITFLFPK
ncbi:MAG: hypothetical protein V2J11_02840 [Desulfofustis sp.]|nr:hypothetical protein [Desulfofustis sp.]